MQQVPTKTLCDLEFPTVLQHLSARCHTTLGKAMALTLAPLTDKDTVLVLLGETSEYLASLVTDNRIPNHSFEDSSTELSLLRVQNSTLPLQGFKNISHICITVATHQKFFTKFETYYPLLFKKATQLAPNTKILTAISAIINRFGEIKDMASNTLQHIRSQVQGVRSKINQSFGAALQHYQGLDFLDEIRESVVENRRVLAVKAMHRRKVRGTVMGSSRTGSIVYIIPEATLRYTLELNNLECEEQEEIQRILRQLTHTVRPYTSLLEAYQTYLTDMDVTAAKATYASAMNALLPEINPHRKLYLKEAYHPLLYLNNRQKQQTTWPQTIRLHSQNRIIVISGPNAGGKSITLKTVGLLQVMLQSGLLIPVHKDSSCCFFDTILTDIGDNQSIENHLSTYSYRLKNMNRFLKQCDAKTLFLIDEFGTGSDPELGGALAEAFLEVFYEREAFGLITTHYANLKVLADELQCAANANMRFNAKTLAPIFQLVLGEAGSSFTFEVAQKNGIPYALINKAKKKITRGKVRFDATIAKLQKERHKMLQTGSRLQEEETKAREEAKRLEQLNAKIKSKLESYQALYDHNQRMIHLGNKVNTAAKKYFVDSKKRPLVSELLRIVATENSKRKKSTAQQAKVQQQKQQQVAQELEQQLKQVRLQKQRQTEKEEKAEKAKPKPIFNIGDRVRIPQGKAIGYIDALAKDKAIVNYGKFTTQISIDQLERVKAKK